MRISTPEDLRELMQAEYTLSPQQWAAVSAPLEPAVVIAGAGSGKTSLMAARVVYLVANGLLRPDEVLGLTFTTKAAAELRQRVREALTKAGLSLLDVTEDNEEVVLEPNISTYNAYASALLTEHGLRIGHEPDTRLMADASRYQLAARAIGQHQAPVELLTDSPKHAIDYLLALDGELSEHLVDPQQLREFDARMRPRVQAALEAGTKGDLPKLLDTIDKRAEVLALVEDYRALKAEMGLMDFSDQISLTARLVDAQPAVGDAERAKYRIVLLDEYQDTSVAQARMLGRIFAGHAVTAVGDPNQAIYGWRGASVSNILHFDLDFPRADAEPVTRFPLTVNRRSDRRILETANTVASSLYDEAQVSRLETKPDAAVGEVRTIVHETYAGELAWLAEQVQAAHDQGTEWREIGVLSRDNDHAAAIFDALSAAEIPVEIVGLSGLLRLPEVSEILATLTLLGDVTANAELLHLLAGPRWAIGPRDLALLGARARELARTESHERGGVSVDEELAAAVAGADPTEVTALCDALEDPGESAYSPQARERFALLAAELRSLRAHVGEPLLDLVRRIIDTCGIDVELASSLSPAAAARRDNLDIFVKAVADFQAIDGSVTLPALLSYLGAEDSMGNGLDIATPSEADSVKLLTLHRAKGLEWDVVFLPGVVDEKFPYRNLRTQWVKGPAVLPIPLRGDESDLPALREVSAKGLQELAVAAKEHQRTEELRLAYVALTRARHRMLLSAHIWKDGRKTPLGPSEYLSTVRELQAGWGEAPDAWIDKPDRGEVNPQLQNRVVVDWPVREHTAEALRRLEAAERIAGVEPVADEGLDLVEQGLVDDWDAEMERLLVEARRDRAAVIEVPMPRSLSATALARLRDDPEAFAADLARPMPRQPSRSARFGTRFHAWVQARAGQQELIDPDELPGRADVGIEDEADFKALTAAFEAGAFGDRPMLHAEHSFSLVLAGQVIRGQIDAIYADGDGFLLVDWKTNRQHTADPLQLAIYRLAWAELQGVPLEKVRAAFYYVRTDTVIEPADLPGRDGLEELFSGRP